MKNLSIRRATGKSATNFATAATAMLTALVALPVVPALAVTPGDIVLGDITVMRIRTASGGVSAEDRASKVQERINEILAIPNLTARDVTIVKDKYGPTLYVHKVKLITVDPDTAKGQGVAPDVLAKTWAHRLMGVIAQVNIRLPGSPAAAPANPANPVVAGSPPAPVTPLENVPPTAPAKSSDDKSTSPTAPPANSPAAPANPPADPPAKPDAPAVPPANPPATPAPAAPVSPAPATPSASGETSAPSAAS